VHLFKKQVQKYNRKNGELRSKNTLPFILPSICPVFLPLTLTHVLPVVLLSRNLKIIVTLPVVLFGLIPP